MLHAGISLTPRQGATPGVVCVLTPLLCLPASDIVGLAVFLFMKANPQRPPGQFLYLASSLRTTTASQFQVSSSPFSIYAPIFYVGTWDLAIMYTLHLSSPRPQPLEFPTSSPKYYNTSLHSVHKISTRLEESKDKLMSWLEHNQQFSHYAKYQLFT